MVGNIVILGITFSLTVAVTGFFMIQAFKQGANLSKVVEKERIVENVVENETTPTKSNEKVPDNIENIINEWLNGETEKERG